MIKVGDTVTFTMPDTEYTAEVIEILDGDIARIKLIEPQPGYEMEFGMGRLTKVG